MCFFRPGMITLAKSVGLIVVDEGFDEWITDQDDATSTASSQGRYSRQGRWWSICGTLRAERYVLYLGIRTVRVVSGHGHHRATLRQQ